jgi:hypothetical protein
MRTTVSHTKAILKAFNQQTLEPGYHSFIMVFVNSCLPYSYWHGCYTQSDMLWCRKIYGDKGQPYDTGRIHGESNKFGFIEGFRDFPCQHGVHCANNNQEYWVGECYHTLSVGWCLKLKKKHIKTLWSSKIITIKIRLGYVNSLCFHFIDNNAENSLTKSFRNILLYRLEWVFNTVE